MNGGFSLQFGSLSSSHVLEINARREDESNFFVVTRAIFFCLLLFCATSQATTPFTVADASGTQIVFITPPQRIISLAPNLTELAYAAGMGNRMVAVTAYSDYPPQAKQLPQVGDAFRLDWERLVALKPDLVLAWGSSFSSRDRATFEKLKLKVLVLEPRRLDDIPNVLRLLGRVADTEPVAEAAAHAFVQQLNALRRQYAGRTKVRAYFQIAAAPLLTVNGAHIISDVLHLCGAQNVFAAVPLLTPAISNEALVKESPQVMLAVATTHEQEEETKRIWRGLPLIAVRQGHMAFIHPDLISRSTPRILLGAKRICEQIESVRH
ncbi:Vitamin B12 ABC transporter, B12-binding component BtuF [Candidatus Nitrotoga sp. HW29]|uniref:cobalamin-binding protein n=1 Tax=Candidatus Nitrotoga sp. HW29 TaxID=2886963 RepID=UPI001EF2E598|nr:cobalamin-binding protein [Candidatus Nitrotoga sp. HW29]CAH1904825.1 Vitamin B12 ABC transporter, B12-binding component BtuF [Candidatus Nitrotoga sp. HW29]